MCIVIAIYFSRKPQKQLGFSPIAIETRKCFVENDSKHILDANSWRYSIIREAEHDEAIYRLWNYHCWGNKLLSCVTVLSFSPSPSVSIYQSIIFRSLLIVWRFYPLWHSFTGTHAYIHIRYTRTVTLSVCLSVCLCSLLSRTVQSPIYIVL